MAEPMSGWRRTSMAGTSAISITRAVAPGGVLDLVADVRRGHAAAVDHGGVRGRHLQGRRLQVALPAGEVDVVADRPRAIGLALLEQAVAPLRRGQQALELP